MLKSKRILLGIVGLVLGLSLLIPFPVSAATEVPPEGAGTTPTILVPKPGEKAVSLETEKIDEVGKKLGGNIDKMGKKASAGVGKWIDAKVYGSLSWLKLVICLVLVAGVFVGERLLRWLMRWVLGRIRAEGPTFVLLRESFTRLTRPVTLFIRVYGSYAALSLLFVHFERADGSNLLQAIVKKAADAGGVASLVWLAYIVLGVADRRLGEAFPPGESLLRSVVRHCRAPVRLLVTLLLARVALPLLGGFQTVVQVLGNALAVCLIGSVAWLLIRGTLVLEERVFGYYKIDVRDNLTARRVQTQVRFFRRVVVGIVVVVAASSMLMLFDKVRQLGAGILTSAGIAGVVVGFAAQRSLANLLVGIQIAITQPIRIDDVVIVENEWGKIEEITSTYAVVRIWDLRRLIVPLTYFTEKPFQNWTRTSAEILGTVYLYTDYGIPVEALRGELERVLENSPRWDGKVCGLQVTDAREKCLELRALMSASDASLAWDLRCEVREALITFIQERFPEYLPKTRAEIRPDGAEHRIAGEQFTGV